ncbi:hypothetical protein POM88_009981 [Heracleum sosnowskyi]|uniref:Ubiquitin-like protease family profile domain-containing protein n=1 Tax=Heracleum sosnowskyi TaxID=360622 RepID=A0AAD8JA48_9APIA|nr:hypothetical protein POM88_009981 [Heracleum sosnowskyi]
MPNIFVQHVDVFFYHLRKKLKSTSPLKITYVDSTFQSRLSATFETINLQAAEFIVDLDIAEIIKGEIISYNIPWALSDEVLFPIWLAEQGHWILGRLNFIDGELHIYNTLQCDGVRDIIAKAANPFVQLLPSYLKATGFYDRIDINFSVDAYFGKTTLDWFGLTLHHFEFPSSSSIDSGIYMLSYAEYYATMPDFLQGEIDIGAHRCRLAFLFYSYGMAKQIYDYASESNNIAKAPTTKASSTKAPSTKAPTTKAPSTKAPTTKTYDRKIKARDVKKGK